jgi:SdrD B-like domain
MRGLFQFLNPLARTSDRQKPARAARRPAAAGFQPRLELLEDRSVPSAVSSIVSNFNGTAIPAGNTIWFSSAFKPSGLGSDPVTLHVTDQTISFSAAGTDYTVAVPDSLITLSPTATTSTATFDVGANTWDIVVPTKFSGNAFLGGAAFQVATALPGGINPVTWTASFSSDTAGVSLNWQWAAAVYSNFSSDYSTLGVKPLDSPKGTLYGNSDHAGTPESFKTFVKGGARGGGGSNFTGSMSATAKVTVPVGTPPATASISGFVYNDVDNSGDFGADEFGIGGVTVTLTGTDALGNPITPKTTTTNPDGSYSFTGLAAGNYTVTESDVPPFGHNQSNVGTVNGIDPDGTAGTAQITDIVLVGGNSGVNYDFGEVSIGS